METTDKSHLKILAICHYVMAALVLLGALSGLLWIFSGVAALSVPQDMVMAEMANEMAESGTVLSTEEQAMAAQMGTAVAGWGLIGLGAAILILGVIWGVLTLMTGLKLKNNKGRTFCNVMSVIQLLNLPLGTLLGIFTLVVLARPTVKELFQ